MHRSSSSCCLSSRCRQHLRCTGRYMARRSHPRPHHDACHRPSEWPATTVLSLLNCRCSHCLVIAVVLTRTPSRCLLPTPPLLNCETSGRVMRWSARYRRGCWSARYRRGLPLPPSPTYLRRSTHRLVIAICTHPDPFPLLVANTAAPVLSDILVACDILVCTVQEDLLVSTLEEVFFLTHSRLPKMISANQLLIPLLLSLWPSF